MYTTTYDVNKTTVYRYNKDFKKFEEAVAYWDFICATLIDTFGKDKINTWASIRNTRNHRNLTLQSVYCVYFAIGEFDFTMLDILESLVGHVVFGEIDR